MNRALQIHDTRGARRCSEKVVAQPEAHGAAILVLLRRFRALPDLKIGIEQIAELGLERQVVAQAPPEYEVELARALLLLVGRAEHADFHDPLADEVVKNRGLYPALRVVVAGLQVDDQRRLALERTRLRGQDAAIFRCDRDLGFDDGKVARHVEAAEKFFSVEPSTDISERLATLELDSEVFGL